MINPTYTESIVSRLQPNVYRPLYDPLDGFRTLRILPQIVLRCQLRCLAQELGIPCLKLCCSTRQVASFHARLHHCKKMQITLLSRYVMFPHSRLSRVLAYLSYCCPPWHYTYFSTIPVPASQRRCPQHAHVQILLRPYTPPPPPKPYLPSPSPPQHPRSTQQNPLTSQLTTPPQPKRSHQNPSYTAPCARSRHRCFNPLTPCRLPSPGQIQGPKDARQGSRVGVSPCVPRLFARPMLGGL